MSGAEPHAAAGEQPGPGYMSAAKLANYRSERGARAYLDDHRKKLHRRWSDRRERRILTELLGAAAPVGRLLDVPCGFGRLLDLLRDHAAEVVEADVSESMLALNAELHGDDAAEYLRCSALDIPVPDRAFDTTVSVRLNHHLDTEADRLRHLDELCRVTRGRVVLTFFSSSSWKDRLRRLRRRFDGKRPKNTLAPAQVVQRFAQNGFRVDALRPLSRLASGHVYVRAVRSEVAPDRR